MSKITQAGTSKAIRDQRRHEIRIRDGFGADYKGVITHGQVLNRTATKDDAAPNYFAVDLVISGPIPRVGLFSVFGSQGPIPQDAEGDPSSPTVDDYVTVMDLAPTTFSVLDNDVFDDETWFDVEVEVVNPPQFGTLQQDPEFTGIFTYVPGVEFIDTDTFSYQLAGEEGLRTEEATVTLQAISEASSVDLTVSVSSDDEPRELNKAVNVEFSIENQTDVKAMGVALRIVHSGDLSITFPGTNVIMFSPDSLMATIQLPDLDAHGSLVITGVVTRVAALGGGSISAVVTSITQERDSFDNTTAVEFDGPAEAMTQLSLSVQISGGNVIIHANGSGANVSLEESDNLHDWITVSELSAAVNWSYQTSPLAQRKFYRVRSLP